MENPLISVIILTWNRKDDLIAALASVYQQEYEKFEVVVVDSNSTDGTQEAVCSIYPDVKYIRLPYNYGVIGGRNIGMANASGELILLLDDDAEFTNPNAFQLIAKRFSKEPELAVVYFQYHLEDGEQWGWILPYRPLPDLVEQSIYTSSFVGCAHCFHREWLERVGYLKQVYFREGEEADFSYRILAAGGRILYFPDVKVLHRLNPNQRIHAEHQALKFVHRTENDLTYMAWYDALAIVGWRLSTSFFRSITNGWFYQYLSGLWQLLVKIPLILQNRCPLNSETMNLVRTLRTYAVVNYDTAKTKQTTFYDWLRVRVNHMYLGVI